MAVRREEATELGERRIPFRSESERRIPFRSEPRRGAFAAVTGSPLLLFVLSTLGGFAAGFLLRQQLSRSRHRRYEESPFAELTSHRRS